MKRVEVGDAQAITGLACYYNRGDRGLPQDSAKAIEASGRRAWFCCSLQQYCCVL